MPLSTGMLLLPQSIVAGVDVLVVFTDCGTACGEAFCADTMTFSSLHSLLVMCCCVQT